MPFIHPLIFWGGAGAVSVPVLIHLLNRRRFRVKDWAAMQFLLESVRRNRRRLRIEELILLALRCLILLIAGMALARFTGCAGMDILPAGEGDRTVVYLLDDSYSMGQKMGSSTVFARATTDLVDQLQAMPKRHKIAILRTSEVGTGKMLFRPNFVTDVDSLTDRIRSLEAALARSQQIHQRAVAQLRQEVAALNRLVVEQQEELVQRNS